MELKPVIDSINVTIDNNNNIVTVRPNPGFDINLKDIKTTFFWAVREIKPLKMNAMVVGAQGISFDPDARNFLKSDEFQENINHYALVVSNFGQRLIVDFLFKLQKPLFTYKVFTTEDKAMEWLKSKVS
jgi:hypothetical protein